MTGNRTLQLLAIISGMLAVIAGAAGAHGPLAPSEPMLQHLLATALLFHLTHSLALLQFTLWRAQRRSASSFSGWLFVAGITLFVGTLDWHGFTGQPIMPVLTPVGGGLLILAWLSWGVQLLRQHG